MNYWAFINRVNSTRWRLASSRVAAIALAVIALVVGCGEQESPDVAMPAADASKANGPPTKKKPSGTSASKKSQADSQSPRPRAGKSTGDNRSRPRDATSSDGSAKGRKGEPSSDDSNLDSLFDDEQPSPNPKVEDAPLDEAAIAAAGFRRIAGKHITLYTDVPSSTEVDELPKVFDLAVPQWIEHLHLDAKKLAGWHIRAVLLKEKGKSKQADLMPGDLPDFLHGFARRKAVWLYDQPTDYYRRHLLLHEGTHAAMYQALGRAGPPWFSEGVAEYMATHRWQDGKLTLGTMPADREETPGLGRIKIIREEFAANRALPLFLVLALGPDAHQETRAYAWSWAAVTLLGRHPHYRDKLPKLLAQAGEDDMTFELAYRQLFDEQRAALDEDWRLLVANMEYGYDFDRTAVDYTPGKPLDAAKKVTIAADRGWQNSGIRVEEGKTYTLKAKGRYQVATSAPPAGSPQAGKSPRIWWSEPGGVSIRYYQGRPLGMLLAGVWPGKVNSMPAEENRDAKGKRRQDTLVAPVAVGLRATITPSRSGTLFLKINDSAAELADNAGTLEVEIAATE